VWFVVKRRGCCCNLSGDVVLIVWFTTNGMCMKNNTIVYVARASNSERDCEHDLYCCLLPRCEALRTQDFRSQQNNDSIWLLESDTFQLLTKNLRFHSPGEPGLLGSSQQPCADAQPKGDSQLMLPIERWH